MLLVYMSTWFDDTGDDGAGGDVPAGLPTQNLSRGAATLADAGPIGLHLQNHLAASECARSSTMACATQLYYGIFPFPASLAVTNSTMPMMNLSCAEQMLLLISQSFMAFNTFADLESMMGSGWRSWLTSSQAGWSSSPCSSVTSRYS